MLKFLIDENLRSHAIWQAILDWQKKFGQTYPLDAVRVGQATAPPTGTSDPDLISFCILESRVLVSVDRRTLPGQLAQRQQAGDHVPGIILFHGAVSAGEIAELLATVSWAGDPAEFANQITWLP